MVILKSLCFSWLEQRKPHCCFLKNLLDIYKAEDKDVGEHLDRSTNGLSCSRGQLYDAFPKVLLSDVHYVGETETL